MFRPYGTFHTFPVVVKIHCRIFTSNPHFCTVNSHYILAVAVVQVTTNISTYFSTKTKKTTTDIYVGFSETLPRLNQPALSLII
jgi:hypothetical protein